MTSQETHMNRQAYCTWLETWSPKYDAEALCKTPDPKVSSSDGTSLA